MGRGHPHPTPCALVAHHQGVFLSLERRLQEAVVAVAPNLGAPGWASCSWGTGEVEGLDLINLVSFILLLCGFFPPS